MTWWAAPPGGRLVYVPSLEELMLLPAYKRDAYRTFVDGISPRLLKGTAVEIDDDDEADDSSRDYHPTDVDDLIRWLEADE